MVSYSKFLGLLDLPDKTQNLMRRFAFYNILSTAILTLSTSIFVLHIIDVIGFLLASQIITIFLVTQLVLDYPSGSLGDYIGQKWVLNIAHITGAVALVLFAYGTTFASFILPAIFWGISQAQLSGALQSWLDSNYQKLEDGSDPDRKNYGYTMSRLGSIIILVNAGVIIIAGFLATNISRTFVFNLQMVLMVFLVPLTLVILRDSGMVDHQTRSVSIYLNTLKSGLLFAISKRSLLFFVLGSSFMMAMWLPWGQLILFPLYFGYAGTDTLTGVLRSSIFLIATVLSILTASLTKKLNDNKLPYIFFAQTTILFVGVITLLTVFPRENMFNLLGLLAVFVVFILSNGIFGPIVSTVQSRVLVDLVPSEFRNSIYSLTPTIGFLLGSSLIPVVGYLITQYGMQYGVLVSLICAWMAVLCYYLSIRQIDKEKDMGLTLVVPCNEIPPVCDLAATTA